MNAASFDAALAGALRSTVTDAVPRTIIDDLVALGGVEPRQEHRGAAIAATVAVGATLVAAGAFAAGSARPVATREDAALGAADGGPLIATADGSVFVRRSDGGHTLELVLQQTPSVQLVLASEVESAPGANVSFGSIHQVTCPASTGLKQAFYAFGQETGGSTITLHDISGTVSKVARNMYVIALDPSTMTGSEWRYTSESGGGGWSRANFDHLPAGSRLQASGCYTTS